MAEMTKDMYGAVGRLGNKTFYLRGGKTIARTITKPKNPKTEGQSLHRVLVKAVNKAYSMLKGICNHSFEGYNNSFDSMNKFRRVNLKYIREHVATLLESDQGLDFSACAWSLRPSADRPQTCPVCGPGERGGWGFLRS